MGLQFENPSNPNNPLELAHLPLQLGLRIQLLAREQRLLEREQKLVSTPQNIVEELEAVAEIGLGLELDKASAKTVRMLVFIVDTSRRGFKAAKRGLQIGEHLECLKAAFKFAFIKQIPRLFLASQRAYPFELLLLVPLPLLKLLLIVSYRSY